MDPVTDRPPRAVPPAYLGQLRTTASGRPTGLGPGSTHIHLPGSGPASTKSAVTASFHLARDKAHPHLPLQGRFTRMTASAGRGAVQRVELMGCRSQASPLSPTSPQAATCQANSPWLGLLQGWVQCQWMPAPAPAPLSSPEPQSAPLAAPPAAPPLRFRVTFDRIPVKLAYFFNRVWPYINHYGEQYQTDHDIISAIVDGMNEGDAAEWITQLHNECTPEFKDADEFVQLLWVRFEDTATGRKPKLRSKP